VLIRHQARRIDDKNAAQALIASANNAEEMNSAGLRVIFHRREIIARNVRHRHATPVRDKVR
jgi:hypothetical protein